MHKPLLKLAVAATLAVVSGWNRPCIATTAGSPPQPPMQSGVYGFSGAGVPLEQPEGVIGECIWIFDTTDHRQVAKAECLKSAPGRYRVVLAPGRYVLHGPGGRKQIEIKPRTWLKVDSIAMLPGGR